MGSDSIGVANCFIIQTLADSTAVPSFLKSSVRVFRAADESGQKRQIENHDLQTRVNIVWLDVGSRQTPR